MIRITWRHRFVTVSAMAVVVAGIMLPASVVVGPAGISLTEYTFSSSQSVIVPEMLGDTVAFARVRLEAEGLQVGTVVTEKNPDGVPCTVLRISPRAGSLVARGTAVNLVIVKLSGPDGAAEAAQRCRNLEEAAQRYGYGPSRNAKIVYQPDVVLIEEGPRAIKEASADGFTWTIDGTARGAQDVQPGKVMFASSQAVGRVVTVAPAGTDRVVTLAPVQLTEVIRDGRLAGLQPLHFGALGMQEIPGYPAAFTDLARGVTSAGTGSGALPPPQGPPPQGVVKLGASVGETGKVWGLEVVRDTRGIGFRFTREVTSGLKVGGEVDFMLSNAHVRTDVPISNGVFGATSFQLDGIEGIRLKLVAASAKGLSDNEKVLVEVPITLVSQPIVVSGVPTVLDIKFNFLVETAFSAQNSTLTAEGEWGLDGPLGTGSKPTFSVKRSILDRLEGISAAPSGMVVAVGMRAM
jgi:hypothetical protein